MVRPVEFDNDVVLSSALQCFWKQGYAATSMRDLEKATSLSTGSIYNSFGNKEKLFEKAFDFYVDKVIGRRIRDHLENENAREGILAFFEESLNNPPDIRAFGCLLVNTAIESDIHSPKLVEKMRLAHKRVNTAMQEALIRAIEAGQINQDIDTKSMADNLGMILSGLLVKVKTSKGTSWHAGTLKFISDILD